MLKSDNIYSVVKTVKSRTSLDLLCVDHNSRLSGKGMMSQVKAVEQKLQIVSSELINETLSKEELKTAGELFLYLIMCPETDRIRPWLVFYKELFQTQSPDHIILTLNRVMTATQTKKYFKRKIELLLKRILSMLHGRKTEYTVSKDVASQPQKLKGIDYYYTLHCSTVVHFIFCRFYNKQSSSSHFDKRQQNISLIFHTIL